MKQITMSSDAFHRLSHDRLYIRLDREGFNLGRPISVKEQPFKKIVTITQAEESDNETNDG